MHKTDTLERFCLHLEPFFTAADHLSEIVPFCAEQIGLERFGVYLH